jgi:hypothetical protein
MSTAAASPAPPAPSEQTARDVRAVVLPEAAKLVLWKEAEVVMQAVQGAVEADKRVHSCIKRWEERSPVGNGMYQAWLTWCRNCHNGPEPSREPVDDDTIFYKRIVTARLCMDVEMKTVEEAVRDYVKLRATYSGEDVEANVRRITELLRANIDRDTGGESEWTRAALRGLQTVDEPFVCLVA